MASPPPDFHYVSRCCLHKFGQPCTFSMVSLDTFREWNSFIAFIYLHVIKNRRLLPSYTGSFPCLRLTSGHTRLLCWFILRPARSKSLLSQPQRSSSSLVNKDTSHFVFMLDLVSVLCYP
jgi:hypothetical protein